jgi:dipeptidyl-peptidase 4
MQTCPNTKGLPQGIMRTLISGLLASALLFGATTAIAQTVPAPKLTIERVFDDPALNGPVPRAARFSPDGKLVTWLRPNDADFLRLDLWAMPTAGGAPFMLVDSKALVPEERELSEAEKARRERQRIASSRGIVSYDWDKKGEAILVPLGGDIYYVPVTNPRAPRRLTSTPQFETDAQVSPGGGYVSFIRDATLVGINLASGAETILSPAGAGDVSYGMAEFIAQEEMDRDTGYWWAPEDSAVVFARVDESGVAMVPRVEIGATSTAIVEQRYPRAGAANAEVSLFIRDIASGTVRPVDLGNDADIYVARVDWSKDGKTIYVQRQNRSQTRLDLLMVDPATGTSRVILSETDSVWLNLTKDFTPLKSGDFLWTSERTGWRHIERWYFACHADVWQLARGRDCWRG